jgi:hypothetical protein
MKTESGRRTRSRLDLAMRVFLKPDLILTFSSRRRNSERMWLDLWSDNPIDSA